LIAARHLTSWLTRLSKSKVYTFPCLDAINNI
jgi:hypothetical protein